MANKDIAMSEADRSLGMCVAAEHVAEARQWIRERAFERLAISEAPYTDVLLPDGTPERITREKAIREIRYAAKTTPLRIAEAQKGRQFLRAFHPTGDNGPWSCDVIEAMIAMRAHASAGSNPEDQKMWLDVLADVRALTQRDRLCRLDRLRDAERKEAATCSAN